MKLQEHTFTKPCNGIPAGTYAWFTSRKEAEQNGMKHCKIEQTTPGSFNREGIFRVMISI